MWVKIMNNSYVKISITGKNPNLFIKRFLINKLVYKELKQVNYKTITLKILYKDYLVLKEKNTVYEIKLIKYYGISKYINYLKENLSFMISFIICILMLFIISNTCFDIVIVHNDDELRNLVENKLNEYDIRVFSIIPSFEIRKNIIEKIVNDEKDKIEWLEIEKKGSKLIVKLTERKHNPKKEEETPRHIVAKKNGIIKSIEASSGVIVKKKNDYVRKGDIIVSGNIIKDETIKGQVKARGIVYAEVWYKVNVEYPLYYEEVTYLNEIKNNIIVTIFDKEFSLRKDYTDSYLEKKYILTKDKIFPFSIRSEKQRKTKVTKEELKAEKALEKAIKKAEDKLSVKLSDNEYIISKKTLNYRINESKIIVDVFFNVNENITDYKTATLDEIIG